MTWWRAHDDSVDNPKLQRLAPALFKHWYNLCCLTSANGGILPPIADVAFKLRVKIDKARAIVAELVTLQLMDMDSAGVVAPHNWARRQFKTDVTDPTNAERQARYRKRHPVTEKVTDGTVTPTVTAKLPETENRITETEKKEDAANAAPTQAELERELFRRGAQVCGKASGGLIASLLKSKQHDVALARSVVELAATKSDPREFVAAATRSTVNGKRTVQQAASDLLDRVRAFDEPAPSELRDGTGEADVRLLSPR